jgi:hypothetical protein
MPKEYCEECDEFVNRDLDGNIKPCGHLDCPYGILFEDEDPQELDFNE